MKKYDITGTDLRKLIAAVYSLSAPQGMGFLHFREGPISDDVIDHILAKETYATRSGGDGPIIELDYVGGRACKFTVWRQDGRLLIDDRWYDHSHGQLQELLATDGVVNNGLVDFA